MPPLWQYLCAQGKKGRRVHCCPQRAWTPDPRQPFPCKTAVSGGPREGAIIAFLDPELAAVRLETRPCPRCGSTSWDERQKKALAAMCAPKGVGPGHLGHFSCKKASEGAEEGAKRCRSWTPRSAAAGASARGSWGRRSCRRCGSTCSRREKNSISLRPDGLSDQNNFGEMDAHRRAAVGMRRRESPDSSPLTRLSRCAHVDCQRLHSRNQECEHAVRPQKSDGFPLKSVPDVAPCLLSSWSASSFKHRARRRTRRRFRNAQCRG